MIRLIHGDNQLLSRQALITELEQAKKQQMLIFRLEAKTLQFAQLETAITGQDLFASPSCLVIEGLLSLPKSALQAKLIEFVCAHHQPLKIILWEPKELGKVALRPFLAAEAEISLFKPTDTLFAWLDSLSIPYSTSMMQKQRLAFKENEVELCFALLIGRIRLLIQIADGETPKGAPFYIQKLRTQAQRFSVTQLLAVHQKLVAIDWRQKTSTSMLDLASELDLLWLTR